jgi:hypothetical protein
MKQRSSVAVTIVACVAIGADRAESTAFQQVYWRADRSLATAVVSLFRSRCPATSLYATIRTFVIYSM